MLKRVKFTMVAAAAAILASSLAPTVAFAATTYKDGWSEKELPQLISDKLDNDNLVIGPDANLSNQKLLKEADLRYDTIIVALKKSTLEGRDPEDFGRYLFDKDNENGSSLLTLLVVNELRGKDVIYPISDKKKLQSNVYRVLGKSSATKGGVETDDAGWTILKNDQKISKLEDGYGPSGWVIFVVTFSVIILPFIIGLLVICWDDIRWPFVRLGDRISRGRRKRKEAKVRKKWVVEDRKAAAAAAKRKEEAEAKRKAELSGLPEDLTAELKAIENSMPYTLKNDEPMHEATVAVLRRFDELREALKLMDAGDHRANMLYTEYAHRFGQIAELLGPRYYQDIKKHPQHWRNADWKLTSILQVLQKTDEQILESIIQLKEGAEFDFQLSIDSLLDFQITPSDMVKPKK